MNKHERRVILPPSGAPVDSSPTRAWKPKAPGEGAPVLEAAGEGKDRDETLDALFQGELKLYQDRDGYRFSLDAVLLAFFATVGGKERVVDLGCGNGVISLILAYLYPFVSVTGVELQGRMADRALRNVQLNRYQKRVEIVCGDVRAIGQLSEPESFDVVVCNPPYRKPSSGRVSPDAEKKVARHEMKGTIQDFLAAGAYLLPLKGRMALIFPAARTLELFRGMSKAALEPKRVRTVHSFADAEASLVLVEAVKGGRSGIKILAPLVVYDTGKNYMAEVDGMLAARPGKSSVTPSS